MDALDEAAAIARLKQGDIGGLEFLVRQHQLQAVRTAYLITQDLSRAEDVVQAAFLRVYKRISQFDSARPFVPWFLRIIVNDAIKAVSRGMRLESLSTGFYAEDSAAGELGDHAADPANLIEMEEYKQMVRDALKILAPDHRAVIVMRYFLDFTEQEMAEQMGVPAGTIKSRLNTARQQLRRWLSSPQTQEGRR